MTDNNTTTETMPLLGAEVKKKFSCVSDRVKCVDLHPTEPWVLASLFNGHVCLWNYTTQVCVLCVVWERRGRGKWKGIHTFSSIPLQALIKNIEISELPVRVAKFIARKQWIICGSDDMMLRVYNYTSGMADGR